MPSPEPGRRDLGALLRSQGLGLLCGFGTVLLLAVGSFVLVATRDGASAGIGMDDLRGFFERPSPAHAWLYLLVPVFGLYVLNTALATWHSVARKWRAGVRSPARYAPALLHVSFLLALVAHGVGGFGGAEPGQAVLAVGTWQELPGRRGTEARLLALEVDRLPNGMPREVRADVELRDGSGRTEQARIGYNVPLSAGLGAELHLLADVGQTPVAHLWVAGERCAAPAGQPCRAAGLELTPLEAIEPGRMGPTALARVKVARPGAAPQVLWLAEGRDAPLADGRPVRLEGLAPRPAILLRARHAPGNPWALAAAVVLGAGVLLLWRRFLPRAPSPAADEA